MIALSPSSRLPPRPSVPFRPSFHKFQALCIHKMNPAPQGASALLLQPGQLSSIAVCFVCPLIWVLGWLLALSQPRGGAARPPGKEHAHHSCMQPAL